MILAAVRVRLWGDVLTMELQWRLWDLEEAAMLRKREEVCWEAQEGASTNVWDNWWRYWKFRMKNEMV